MQNANFHQQITFLSSMEIAEPLRICDLILGFCEAESRGGNLLDLINFNPFRRVLLRHQK